MLHRHLDRAQDAEGPVLPAVGDDRIATDIPDSGLNQPVERAGGARGARVQVKQLPGDVTDKRAINPNGIEGRAGVPNVRATVERVAVSVSINPTDEHSFRRT